MKTTKKITALFTKSNPTKLKAQLVEVFKALEMSNKIYTTTSVGGGNYGSYRDISHNVETVLNAFNAKFTQDNDAPRGGKTGDYYQVHPLTRKAIIKKLVEMTNA